MALFEIYEEEKMKKKIYMMKKATGNGQRNQAPQHSVDNNSTYRLCTLFAQTKNTLILWGFALWLSLSIITINMHANVIGDTAHNEV